MSVPIANLYYLFDMSVQSSGNGSITYSGTTNGGVLPAQAGIKKVLSNLVPNVPVSVKINLVYASASMYIAVAEGSAQSPSVYSNLLYSTMSNGSINFTFTPTQPNVELSMKLLFNKVPLTAFSYSFTLDSVSYTQQTGATSSTQLVQISNKQRDKYRFGFNGQEKDNEIAGVGNHNTAEFWEYDTRVGRRWNRDPKPNISISNYATFNNNPILHSDVLGDSVWLYSTTLPGAPSWLGSGTHTFLVVKTSDDILHYYVYGPRNDAAPMGGSPLIRKSWGDGLNGGYSQDKKIIDGSDKKNLKERFYINTPEGMTQDQFDKKVINVAESFGNNPEIEYNAFCIDPTTGNCNTSTTTILSMSGISDKVINNIDSKMRGVNWGFGHKRPWLKKEQKDAVDKKKKDDTIGEERKKVDKYGSKN